jgi:hypothetical protein
VSEVGKDAHRAAEIAAALKKIELRRSVRILESADAERQSAPLNAELTAIDSKYRDGRSRSRPAGEGGAMSASRHDYDERFRHLEREATRDYPKWDREAREEYSARLTNSRTVAQAPAPAAQPQYPPPSTPQSSPQSSVSSGSGADGPSGGFIFGLLVIFILLPIVLAILLPAEISPRTKADSAKVLQLPENLSRIHVLKKQYGVSAESGSLYEKEIWTETNVTTTTSGGGGYAVGNTIQSNPVVTSTNVSSMVNHRYWLRGADGRERSLRFADNEFLASKGHVISTIETDSSVLLAYNHTTGTFATLDRSLRRMHNYDKRRKIILIGMALATVLLLVFGSSGGASGWFCFLLPAAIAGLVLLQLLRWSVQSQRNREFNRTYRGSLRQFLEESTPHVLSRFGTAQPGA